VDLNRLEFYSESSLNRTYEMAVVNLRTRQDPDPDAFERPDAKSSSSMFAGAFDFAENLKALSRISERNIAVTFAGRNLKAATARTWNWQRIAHKPRRCERLNRSDF